MTNIILGIPNHKPTVVYPQIYKLVSDLDDKYMKLITKWVFLHSGTLVEIPKYDGTLISYRGIRFDGSPELVFWQGFIGPYLENEPLEVFRNVAELSRNTNQDLEKCLDEAEQLLAVTVQRVFEKMADTDQTLKGDGIRKGERKDVSGKIIGYKNYIEKHRKIIELEYSPKEIINSTTSEDIIDLKPNFFGIGLNLNAVWKKHGAPIMKKLDLTRRFTRTR